MERCFAPLKNVKPFEMLPQNPGKGFFSCFTWSEMTAVTLMKAETAITALNYKVTPLFTQFTNQMNITIIKLPVSRPTPPAQNNTESVILSHVASVICHKADGR